MDGWMDFVCISPLPRLSCYCPWQYNPLQYFNATIPKCRPLFVHTLRWMILVFPFILLTLVLIGFQGAKLSGGEEEDVKMGVVHKSLKHLLALGGVRVGGGQAREAVEVSQLQLPVVLFSPSFLFLNSVEQLRSLSTEHFLELSSSSWSVSWHSLLQKDGMVTFSVCVVRHNPTFSIRYDGFWILNSEGWKPYQELCDTGAQMRCGSTICGWRGLSASFSEGVFFSGVTYTQKWTANGSSTACMTSATKGVFPHHLAPHPSTGSLLCNARYYGSGRAV